jgi:WD40-like Beta Propeller Repeat
VNTLALARVLVLAAGIGSPASLAAQSPDAAPRDPVVRAEPPPPARLVGERRSAPQIVFEAPGVPGSNEIQEIYTMNLDGSELRQITRDGLNKFLPHFSPDGKRLVYSKFYFGRYGDMSPETDIATYDFGEDAETRLTFTGQSFAAAWSPDGTRIAFGTYGGTGLWVMEADGSNTQRVGGPSGADDDQRWNDIAWSSDGWIVFTVGQTVNGCFNVRVDKIRPDGSDRTKVSGGGADCTPPGREQSGDADPGISADGRTIYSSRGFPYPPPGFPAQVVRKLYAFSRDAWTPGKAETDLSLPSAPDCIEGVPKGSPDGTRILLFRACAGEPHMGVTLTDTIGSYRTWIIDGFGADWNPAYRADEPRKVSDAAGTRAIWKMASRTPPGATDGLAYSHTVRPADVTSSAWPPSDRVMSVFPLERRWQAPRLAE